MSEETIPEGWPPGVTVQQDMSWYFLHHEDGSSEHAVVPSECSSAGIAESLRRQAWEWRAAVAFDKNLPQALKELGVPLVPAKPKDGPEPEP